MNLKQHGRIIDSLLSRPDKGGLAASVAGCELVRVNDSDSLKCHFIGDARCRTSIRRLGLDDVGRKRQGIVSDRLGVAGCFGEVALLHFGV